MLSQPQQMSTQLHTPNQEKSGKFYDTINPYTLSPEIGHDSDDESIYYPSQDLLSQCAVIAQNNLNPFAAELISRSPSPITPSPLSIQSIDTIIQEHQNYLLSLPVPENIKHELESVPNQFVSTQETQVEGTQVTEHKVQFIPKFNNHAKGNFYISKEKISKMVELCIELFDTHEYNDEKLAFGYFKESVAMQINDRQIRVIRTITDDNIIIIDIDLHFENGNIMYLIAMENDLEHQKNVQWKIVEFMDKESIKNVYGVDECDLPKSSRDTRHFKHALNFAPVNVPISVIYNTNFKKLPGKKSKRVGNGNRRVSISEADLKWYCRESWNNGIIIPVVVIKGKKQWVEWKKVIQIYDRYNQEQWIGISLKYSNRQWKIECLDYDAGRIFYQYRLVGMRNIDERYQINYNELQGYVTTSLNIY